MPQTRIDATGNDANETERAKINQNFDDVFDVVQALYAAYTLTSQTAAQALLNGSPNGALNLPTPGLYNFECQFDLTAMSSTSGAFGFALGGTATLDSQAWFSVADKATDATEAAPQSTYNTAANTALVAATTATVGWANIRGIFRTSAAGTIIPQVSLGVAATAIVSKNAFFRVTKYSNSVSAAVIQPPPPLSPQAPFWT